jgi:hypothetical protein
MTMSLVNEIQELLDNGDTWFDPSLYETVEDEITDTTRWTYVRRVVLRRGDEIVAAEFQEPATEYQDVDDIEGIAYYVEPVIVERVEYRRKT